MIRDVKIFGSPFVFLPRLALFIFAEMSHSVRKTWKHMLLELHPCFSRALYCLRHLILLIFIPFWLLHAVNLEEF
jgi:hypothetical protein